MGAQNAPHRPHLDFAMAQIDRRNEQKIKARECEDAIEQFTPKAGPPDGAIGPERRDDPGDDPDVPWQEDRGLRPHPQQHDCALMSPA
jgi:hypothetical protein